MKAYFNSDSTAPFSLISRYRFLKLSKNKNCDIPC